MGDGSGLAGQLTNQGEIEQVEGQGAEGDQEEGAGGEDKDGRFMGS